MTLRIMEIKFLRSGSKKVFKLPVQGDLTIKRKKAVVNQTKSDHQILLNQNCTHSTIGELCPNQLETN